VHNGLEEKERLRDWIFGGAHLDNLAKARPDVECRRENTLTVLPLSYVIQSYGVILGRCCLKMIV